jgi:hypothetical protein
MKKTIKFLIALAPWLLFSGCAGLADREDRRPAPHKASVMDDLDATLAAQQADPTSVQP